MALPLIVSLIAHARNQQNPPMGEDAGPREMWDERFPMTAAPSVAVDHTGQPIGQPGVITPDEIRAAIMAPALGGGALSGSAMEPGRAVPSQGELYDQAGQLRQKANETRAKASSGKPITPRRPNAVETGVAALLTALSPVAGQAAIQAFDGQQQRKAQEAAAKREQAQNDAEYQAKGMELHAQQLEAQANRAAGAARESEDRSRWEAEQETRRLIAQAQNGQKTETELLRQMNKGESGVLREGAARALNALDKERYPFSEDYYSQLRQPTADEAKKLAEAAKTTAITAPTVANLNAKTGQAIADTDLKGAQQGKTEAETATINATRTAQVTKLLTEGKLNEAKSSLAAADKIATNHRTALQDKWYPKKMAADIANATKNADANALRANTAVIQANQKLQNGKPITDTEYARLHDGIQKSIDSFKGAQAMLKSEYDSIQRRKADLKSGAATAADGEEKKLGELEDANRAKWAAYNVMFTRAVNRRTQIEELRRKGMVQMNANAAGLGAQPMAVAPPSGGIGAGTAAGAAFQAAGGAAGGVSGGRKTKSGRGYKLPGDK